MSTHDGNRVDEICQQTPTGIEALVCQDITTRQAHGLNKYGVTVADNPLKTREWVQHQYEESLDHAVYSKRLLQDLHELATDFFNCEPYLETISQLDEAPEALKGLIEKLRKL